MSNQELLSRLRFAGVIRKPVNPTLYLNGDNVSVVNQVERASRAWPVLIAVAQKKHKISYGDLGKALGIHHRAMRFVLA